MAKDPDILDRSLRMIMKEDLGLNHGLFNDDSLSPVPPSKNGLAVERKFWSKPQTESLLGWISFFIVDTVVTYHNDRVYAAFPGNILEDV